MILIFSEAIHVHRSVGLYIAQTPCREIKSVILTNLIGSGFITVSGLINGHGILTLPHTSGWVGTQRACLLLDVV